MAIVTTTFGDVVRAVALGDAWGDPGEFKRLAELTKTNPRGPEVPERLRITDDTQMTLYLADALDLAGPDATMEDTQKAIIEAFLEYHGDPDTGSRAPGTTVMGSLGALRRHGGIKGDWSKATNDHSDGSGTVMRTSPTAFLSEDRWVGVTAFAAAVTHGTANAIAAAILDVAVLRVLLRGGTFPGHLTELAHQMASSPEIFGLLDVGEWIDPYQIPGGLEKGFEELARLLSLALVELPALQADPWLPTSDPSNLAFFDAGYSGAGWRAHHTLVVALLAVDMFPNEPWSGLRRAVVTTGDSDTIGAVAGALLGASGFRVSEEYFSRFEERYQNWIENEADDYLFVAPPVVPEPERKPGWFKRLLSI